MLSAHGLDAHGLDAQPARSEPLSVCRGGGAILFWLVVAATGGRSQLCAATVGFDLKFHHLQPLAPAVAAALNRAESRWESIITGYRDTLDSNELLIVTEVISIDGPGNVLGTGFPLAGKFGSEENFLYSRAGRMQFDADDAVPLADNGLLEPFVLHELGHVIGIGTMWSSSQAGVSGFQELYVAGSGRYTGTAALAAYLRRYDASATFVPVELDGGPGTADLHWNEAAFGDELMTGFLAGPPQISAVTIGSLIDLGYTVSPANLPEPGGWTALVLMVASCQQRRRDVNRRRSI